MAILAVPPVLNGAGDLIPARLFVRLMLANGTSAIGFVGTDLVTEFQNLSIPAEGLEVELTPQASIALESGEATYYEVRVQTSHRTERFVIQLADEIAPQNLYNLVGATAIGPDSVAAEWLLTSDERAAMDAMDPLPDADNPFATIADVESGVAGVASFEGRTGTVTATAGDYQASEITVDATGFDGNLAPTDVTVQMVAQKLDDLVVGGGGDGDVVDGGILATGLTFPLDGLHILDTNASHDLIISPGSNLTADRTLTVVTGDANRSLTMTADASVGGTNTGDQDLSGYVTAATYNANTILAATTDNTPVAVTVAEQTIVGRITGGSIDDLSATQARTLLNVADGATAAGATGDAYATSHESDTSAHPATSIVNTPAGNIAATTVQAALNELDSEKAAASHVHAGTDITSGTIGTAILGSGTANSGTYLRGDSSWAAVAGGDATQAFGTITVAGQSNVVADAAPDTLTLIAGSNITITTDAGADSVTIAAAAHAASHQNGGTDEVATATAAANAIPKAGASSTLDIGWIPVGTTVGTVAAGDDTRFSAIGAIGSGVNFYPTDATIVAAGTNNTYPIKTLAKVPSGLAEDVDAITIPGSSTAMYGTYLYDTALTGDQLDGGIWEFHVYGAVDSATGVTTLTQNVYRVRPETVVTVTTTDTGTSRTCTASGGTPFAAGVIDASTSLLDCSFVQTPQGLYPITARTSDTVVTITTPTTYVNESAVALSVHKKMFGVTSSEINNTAGTAPAWSGIVLLPEMISVQADIPLTAGDRIATSFLGTTTSAGSRILYFAHDGTTRYSHFHTPLELQHNDLEGLQGGTTGQMYHLTAAQATVVGNTSGTNTGDNAANTSIVATKLDDFTAPDDNTDLNTSTTAHGLAPKAVAPASGALNVLGIANGETAISNKTIFEGMLKVVILTRAAYTALGGGRPSTNLYIING